MRRNYQKILLLGVFGVLIFTTVLTPKCLGEVIEAEAAEAGDIAVYPAYWDETEPLTKHWFIYSLDLGQIKEDELKIANLSKIPVELDVYAVDALTTREGAFALRNKDEPKQDVGAWISLTANSLYLGPQEVKSIPFTVKVPANADVGDHSGGIVVVNKEIDQKEVGKQLGMNIITRVGVRVYLNVPGIVERNLKIVKFILEGRKDKQKQEEFRVFVLELKNLGNVRLEPVGEIVVRDIFGRVINELDIEKRGEIFPKDSIVKEVVWPTKFYTVGRFAAQATIFYDDSFATRDLVFWIIPWWLIVALLVILAIIIFLILKKTIRKGRIKKLSRPKRKKSSNNSINFLSR